MILTEVCDKNTHHIFLQIPKNLYQKDKNWICPLDKDITAIFDPSKNKYYQHGVCKRWILFNTQGIPIGRVAAFINNNTAHTYEQPTGGMGFFECIHDQQAANMLFQQCQKWLADQGIMAMDGPINWGKRDNWWGLLVKGFHRPVYSANYHLPYYQSLFENYGFQPYYNQYTYYRKWKDDLQDHVKKRAMRLKNNSHYTFRHATHKNLAKYMEDFRTIYNQAWTSYEEGIEPISTEQAQIILQQLKPILDVKLLWYAYYHDQPIAFFLCMPDVNQYIGGFNGKLSWWNKLRFVYRKYTKQCDSAIGFCFGVVPKFQGKGIESAIVYAMSTVAWAPQFPYQHLEMNWIADFNPVMMRIAEMMGGSIYKTHITYRKLFDSTQPFQRAASININNHFLKAKQD